MTPDEHYRKAEELLRLANGHYTDNSNNALSRDCYETDAAWAADVEFAEKMNDTDIRIATLLARMAQAHATLAQCVEPMTQSRRMGNVDQLVHEEGPVDLAPASRPLGVHWPPSNPLNDDRHSVR